MWLYSKTTFDEYNSTKPQDRLNLASTKTCRLKIGMISVYNRFNYLNGKIEQNWLNLTYDSKNIANIFFLINQKIIKV